jgi:hypothetical protein
MRVIYVSGPYTGDVEIHKQAAVLIGQKVREHGFIPLVPHISICPIEKPDSKKGYTLAMRECLALMYRCDAIVMVPGWERSRGARIERFLARRYAMPVFDTLTQFLKFKEEHGAKGQS